MTRADWAPSRPAEESYRSDPGMSPAECRAQQDRAAGGRDRRLLPLPSGRCATASIELKLWKDSRRVYAYLRHQQDGRTVSRYVGEATAPTREEALARAWRLARAKGLLASSTVGVRAERPSRGRRRDASGA